ncbi:MAG TPA: DUF2505 domain-containing protein [Pseudonocardiaceae bacterium]
MATDIRATHEYPHPATEVASALVDRAYLEARLAELGGLDAALVTHEITADGNGRVVLRQGIPSDRLPSFVRTLVPGHLVIEREETWQRDGETARGAVHATVPGAPATIGGTMEIAPAGPDACRSEVRLRVEVSIPFIGGKVEKVIIDQLRRLLTAENEFTTDWLAQNQR